MELIDHARRYRELGLHPIPVGPHKAPLIPSWKQYQTMPPTDSELTEWFEGENKPNIAVVLGRGMIAVDLDGPGAGDLLRERGITFPVGAPLSRTGNGQHILLKVAEPIGDAVGILNTQGGKPQVDIRGVGYIIVPPSIHANGRQYEWIIPPEGIIPMAPQSLIDLIKSRRAPTENPMNAPGWQAIAMKGVGEGQRDSTCARLAGYFLGKNITPDLTKMILGEIFAKNCSPRFSYADVAKTVDSIVRKRGTIDGGGTPTVQHISEVVSELFASLDESPVRLVPTGMSDLDWFLSGGFQPGDLVYLGARPGVGKTALALQMVVGAAKTGIGCLVVSREMTNLAIARRVLSQQARIDGTRLKKIQGAKHLLPKITEVLSSLSTLPVWFTDTTTTIKQVWELAENLIENASIGLIVVDHLQLMGSPKHGHDKRAQVEAASKDLKNMAMHFKIPVFCMSTLSRPSDKGNARPGLHSLRDSGELEHDADVVLLLHREMGSETAECMVAKNRDGHVGISRLKFEPPFLSFASLDSFSPTEVKPTFLPYKE